MTRPTAVGRHDYLVPSQTAAELVVQLHAVEVGADRRIVGLRVGEPRQPRQDGARQRRHQKRSRHGVVAVANEEAEAAVIGELERLIPVEVVAVEVFADCQPGPRHEIPRNAGGDERAREVGPQRWIGQSNDRRVVPDHASVVSAAAHHHHFRRAIPLAAGKPLARTGLEGHLLEFEVLHSQAITGTGRNVVDQLRADDLPSDHLFRLSKHCRPIGGRLTRHRVVWQHHVEERTILQHRDGVLRLGHQRATSRNHAEHQQHPAAAGQAPHGTVGRCGHHGCRIRGRNAAGPDYRHSRYSPSSLSQSLPHSISTESLRTFLQLPSFQFARQTTWAWPYLGVPACERHVPHNRPCTGSA